MKMSLLALALISGNLFAGTCFKADKAPTMESKLPEVICVENYKFETVLPGLPKSPFYQATVDTSIGTKATEVRFYNSQKAPFKITVELPVHSDSWGSCSYSFNSSVDVSFLVDEKGNTLENSLTVSGKEEENNDPCHMTDRTTYLNYTKI